MDPAKDQVLDQAKDLVLDPAKDHVLQEQELVGWAEQEQELVGWPEPLLHTGIHCEQSLEEVHT
jgi:hypothetical protein